MNYEIVEFKSFPSEKEAWKYLFAYQYDCRDNERFAYLDDPEQVSLYEKYQSQGCCGYHDEPIIVNGRFAKIGCNYGH